MGNLRRAFVIIVKLWLIALFTYVILTACFNWVIYGWIDLRLIAVLQAVTVPLGQSIAFWCLLRPRRKPDQPAG